jgi:hypothetical protein
MKKYLLVSLVLVIVKHHLICSTSYQEHFHSNSLYGLRKKIGWGSLIGLGGLLLTIFHLFATQF